MSEAIKRLKRYFRIGSRGKASNISIQTMDMEFVQSFTPPDFQAMTFTPSIPPNFKGGIDKKNNEFKWRNLHSWQEFYTAAGSGGRDKSQLCLPATS